jgi:A/G-specific adenine glycosylase
MEDARILKLVAWYKKNKRDLPWRSTRDPYAILVSEIMLQQTQVDRVKTPELIRAWAGLGYNRRALMLREAARHAAAHGSPRTIADWIALKGVGPYTAAAVYAITERKRAIVIDTNVRRVMGRIFFGTPYPSPLDDARIAKTLDHVLPTGDRHWEFPQAVMDFGSAVCTPKNPACATCPLKNICKAAPKFLRGTAGAKPRAASRERKHRDKPYPDRIYRGRILAAVRTGRARTADALGPLIDPAYDDAHDEAWLGAMIARLVRDGFLEQRGEKLFLARA